MARVTVEFFQAFFVFTLFWVALLLSWMASADELPDRPKGYTVSSPTRGQAECFPTEEFRKIVLWIETAERYHEANHNLLVLLESTRAELTVVGQESAQFESMWKTSQDEIVRLQLLVVEQQKSFVRDERNRKIRAGLTWGGVSVLVVTAVALGIGWGTDK